MLMDPSVQAYNVELMIQKVPVKTNTDRITQV